MELNYAIIGSTVNLLFIMTLILLTLTMKKSNTTLIVFGIASAHYVEYATVVIDIIDTIDSEQSIVNNIY